MLLWQSLHWSFDHLLMKRRKGGIMRDTAPLLVVETHVMHPWIEFP